MKQLYLIIISVVCMCSLQSVAQENRCGLWLDLYRGEPVTWQDMIDDLASTEIIFLGEAHRVQRHHELQNEIIMALSNQNKQILLGIEQMEAQYTKQLEQYNQQIISFEELADQSHWSEKWRNYQDYKPLLESTLQSGGKVVALNAKSETIRSIGRNGLESLSEAERYELPEEMVFDEPMYEKLLNKLLLVHMTFTEEMLKNVYTAQVARDEMMAAQMSAAWQTIENQDDWIGVVVCGAGHCHYGLGTVSRLQRRLPDVNQRIVLMTESGDTVLTEAEKSMKRDIELSHEDLRFLNRPIADYLHVVVINPASKE